MIAELLTWVRFLIFRKRPSELNEELRFHLEQSIAAKVAARVSVSDARRQAGIEFGGIERTREQSDRQRPVWWAGVISQDVGYAVRGIVAHGWFSGAIVATFALRAGNSS